MDVRNFIREETRPGQKSPWEEYERVKRLVSSRFPDLTPGEYERALQVLTVTLGI